MLPPHKLRRALLLACILAFATAGVAVGVSLDGALIYCGTPYRLQWAGTAAIVAGSVSAACAAAVICIQYSSSSCIGCGKLKRPMRARMLITSLGLAAHVAMLCLVTVFWRYCITRAYIQAYGGNSRRGQVVHRRINYFDYWERWAPKELALYALGCCGGVAAWLAVLALGCVEAWGAAQQGYDAQLTDPLLPTNRPNNALHAAHTSPLPGQAAEQRAQRTEKQQEKQQQLEQCESSLYAAYSAVPDSCLYAAASDSCSCGGAGLQPDTLQLKEDRPGSPAWSGNR